MAWHDILTVRVSCPAHTHYSPEQGPGAIRAGCETCWRLFTLYRAFENVKRSIKEFRDATAARRKP